MLAGGEYVPTWFSLFQPLVIVHLRGDHQGNYPGHLRYLSGVRHQYKLNHSAERATCGS